MDKIFAVIITYKPDVERLKSNVEAFIDFVDKIFIWENMNEDEAKIYRLINHSKIEYFCANGNKGISYALNYACAYAKNEGYNYILTMDQDSIFQDFSRFKQACLNRYKSEDCLIGPLVNQKIESFPIFRSPSDINLITSGMLVPLYILERIGGYCNKFFVDGIDIELCMKAVNSNMNLYQYTGANLEQRFGEHNVVNILSKKLVLKKYSADRLFEIIKNNILIIKKYKEAAYIKRVLWYYLFIHPFLILFYENNKLNKIKSIYRGFYYGLKESLS